MTDSDRSTHTSPSRREFVALGIGAFVVAATPIGFLRRRGLVRRTVSLMGTLAELAVVHRHPRYAHAAIDAAIEELRRVDRTMTRFSPDSDVGRANSMAAGRPVAVSTGTACVLGEALRWARSSAGAFDPCLGRAVELWDVANRNEPPASDRIETLRGRRLYHALEVESSGSAPRVRFHDEDVHIDLGGIGKGYGVDLAAEALRAYGVSDALVSVGGDLYALGRSEDGDAWQVGIRSPADPTRLAHVISVSDAAVATSGDYIQFFDYRGRRYHHLLDPRTAEPRRSRARSLTVVADTCMAADAAATACFGMARGEAASLLRAVAPGARIVHTI